MVAAMILGLMALAAAPGGDRAPSPATGGDLPRRTRPITPMNQWYSPEDYPLEALAREAEGAVRFRLVIGKTGLVESCTILSSSNDEALDAATCAIARERGRFEPARDRNGRAVFDILATTVRWVLPEEEPEPFVPHHVAEILTVSPSGATCRMLVNGEPVLERAVLCPGAEEEVAALLPRPGSLSQRTIVTIVTIPGQRAFDDRGAHYGSRVLQAGADITVSPDGSISACRDTGTEWHASFASWDAFAGVCAALQADPGPGYVAAPPGEVRNAHLSVTVYVSHQTTS